MNLRSVASRRGQNTAEYLILLVLVAVGAITMFGAFGDTIKTQIGAAIFALEGQTQTEASNVSDSLDDALEEKSTMAIKNKEFNTYTGTGNSPDTSDD